MSATLELPVIGFPEDYDAQSEFETPSRGYLNDVEVQVEDGFRYRLYFIDPARLAQNLRDNCLAGRAYFAEPNLIVLPEVTTKEIRAAVAALWREGYFQQLKPMHLAGRC